MFVANAYFGLLTREGPGFVEGALNSIGRKNENVGLGIVGGVMAREMSRTAWISREKGS
mgnify:CR=1 FL=1